MKTRRLMLLVAVGVFALGLLLLPGGAATAGPAGPADTTLSPTPSLTDSPTPSPSPGDCPTGIRFSFLVIDDNNKAVEVDHGSTPPIVYQDPVAYGAALDHFEQTDVSDQPIDIHRIILGTSDDRTLTLTTDNDGVVQTVDIPRWSAYYYATWTGTGICDGVVLQSGTVLNGVRVSITISSSNYKPKAGATFLIRGGVSPNHNGDHVTVQWRRAGSSTIRSSNVTLDSLSHWSKAFHSGTHGARWQFRAIFPKQDVDHQANVTGWIEVTIQ